MIRISIEKAGSFDKAVKLYKKKYSNYGIMRELKERKNFTKPSVEKRRAKSKAKLREHWRIVNNELR